MTKFTFFDFLTVFPKFLFDSIELKINKLQATLWSNFFPNKGDFSGYTFSSTVL